MSLHDAALAAIDDYQATLDQDNADKALLGSQLATANAKIAALTNAELVDQQTIAALQAKIDALTPPLFTEPLVNTDALGVYNAAKSYASEGIRLSENVELANGVVSIHTRPVAAPKIVGGIALNPGDYAAGGFSWKQPLNPGCRISMDLLMTACSGGRSVAMLWPEGPWPQSGELDFVEDGGDIPDRQSTAITNHWYTASKISPSNLKGNDQRVVKFAPHDFTKMSHVSVLWQKDLFVVSVDDVEAARFVDHIPQGPMHLVIQTAVAGGGKAPTWNGVARTPGRIDCTNIKVYPA